MKSIIILSLFALPALSFAIPEKWDVDLAAQSPQVFTLQRPRGETYELEAVLNVSGKPFAPAITNACIYWQTNGMENLYWSAPASVSNNVLRAFWLPEMDPGATTVRGYIGDPGHIYAAAFQFRFIASPGPTPNVLPLPVPVIDFAKVRVLNPPWPGGGSEAETNLVRAVAGPMIADATNGIRSVDGAARPLPRYLHALDFFDSYPDEAAAYYRSRGNGKTDGGCSSVRSGGFLCRNFDYPFDDRAEFVVRMSAGKDRFASVGVAQVGTNLTEQMVTSGKWSKWYKALPGATVDGINENGVVAEINVVDGDPQTSGWHNDTGDLHPLAAVRWVLDNATNAQSAAGYIAANIRFPQGWEQNFHYMIADETATYIIENGTNYEFVASVLIPFPVMTNGILYPKRDVRGTGVERFNILCIGYNITNVWYTTAYTGKFGNWNSDFGWDSTLMATSKVLWAQKQKEAHRGETFEGYTWWQSVHTSIYDITNRVLRVAVQEVDDWYVFQVPSAGAKIDTYTRAETDAKLAGKLDKSPDGRGNYVDWNGYNLEVMANEIHLESSTPIRTTGGDVTAEGIVNPETGNVETHKLSEKANRPISFSSGNLASLDENGDLANSGIGTNDVKSVVDTYAAVSNAAMNAVQKWELSHTNATFAAEVLAVGVDWDAEAVTNAVAALNDFKAAFAGLDAGDITGGAATIGSLLLALIGAVRWLKKKTSLLKSDGTAEDDFATNLFGKPVAVSAMRYGIASTSATVKAADRTVTKVTLGTTAVTVTFPDADENGKTRDFLLRIDAENLATGGSLIITKPDGATIYGDEFPSPEAAKQYLVAITETAANEFYVRTIEITIPTEA